MKILHIGDIVGSAGRNAFVRIVPGMRERGEVDFVVVNGENSAGGKGITPAITEDLLKHGADIVTLGDHAWDQREILPFIQVESRLIRPANFAPGCPGKGWVTVDTAFGKISVISLIGRVFMPPNDCPFRMADNLLARGMDLGKIIMIEMHAEATSEKIAIGRYLDGRVTSVVGTHTHVQTADERVLPKGTGYLSDLGMTGPKSGVLGRDYESVLKKFLTGLPGKWDVAKDWISLEGVLLDVDEMTGKCRSIKRVQEPMPSVG